MRRTHAAAGLALGFGLGCIHHQPMPTAFVFALVTEACALLPDLDIQFHIKHRTVTHSLLALVVISLAAWRVDTRLLLPVALGYGSHLLLDSLTVWGIPILWPVQKRFRLMKLSTGGRMDSLVAVGALCAALWCVVTLMK